MINSYTYETILGYITIVTEDNFLIQLNYDDNIVGNNEETPLIKEIKKELDEYFTNKRKTFSIKLKLKGTDFQKQVWQELINIPYNQTISYQDLANKIKNKNYARVVGTAISKNPIPIIIPCHRVINTNGNLGGYSGGLEIKQILLEIEGEENV